jgi:hypothetical protein
VASDPDIQITISGWSRYLHNWRVHPPRKLLPRCAATWSVAHALIRSTIPSGGASATHQDMEMLRIVATQSTPERALLGAKLARVDLEAGITTVRDLGELRRVDDAN